MEKHERYRGGAGAAAAGRGGGQWAGVFAAGAAVVGRAAAPWPRGRFRATTLALIQRLQAAFPPGVRWRRAADRGFPRATIFAQLRQGGTGSSVRLAR